MSLSYDAELERLPWLAPFIEEVPPNVRKVLMYQWEEIARFLNKFSTEVGSLIEATDYYHDLTDAATIVSDARDVDSTPRKLFRVTVGGDRTLGNPSNPKGGQPVGFLLRQDATGGRILTLDTKFRTAQVSFTFNTTALAWTYLGTIYNSVDDTFDVVACVSGYGA